MKALWSAVLMILGGVAGCGQNDFSLSQPEDTRSATRVLQDPDNGVETNPLSENQSNADASPTRQPIKLSPPTPVTGSYLVGELIDADRMPVKDAEVILREEGLEAHTVKTDSRGRYRVGIVSLQNVTSITAVTVSSQASLAIEKNILESLKLALQDANGGFQRLFQLQVNNMTVKGETSQLNYQVVVPPEQDNTNPVIMSLSVSETVGRIRVTVVARDAESGLAALAYSYDRGASWTSEPEKILPAGTVITPGLILVRDRANNRAANTITVAAQ